MRNQLHAHRAGQSTPGNDEAPTAPTVRGPREQQQRHDSEGQCLAQQDLGQSVPEMQPQEQNSGPRLTPGASCTCRAGAAPYTACQGRPRVHDEVEQRQRERYRRRPGGGRVAHSGAGAEHTFGTAAGRPDSPAFARPDSVRFRAGAHVRKACGMAVPMCSTPAHPLRLNSRRVASESRTGALTMAQGPKSAHAGGTLRLPARSSLSPSSYVPPHFLRRKAREIVLRAAMRGRISWCTALPLLDQIGGAQ
jgi:hypothetical protein